MRLLYTAVLLAVGASVTFVGCRPSGPPTFRLSGTVTFVGKPVPMGKIYFDPLNQPGLPSGYADIVDGRYDTSRTGRDVCGGSMTVRIQGHSRENVDAISGYGPPLFNEYTVAVDLPRENGVKDFDVPEAAAKNLKPFVPLDP